MPVIRCASRVTEPPCVRMRSALSGENRHANAWWLSSSLVTPAEGYGRITENAPHSRELSCAHGKSLLSYVGMGVRVLAFVLLSAGLSGAQTAAPFEVEEATIAQVHDAMRD